MKRKELVLDLAKFTNIDKSFTPHYQFERPLEFNALVGHYMKYYYDEKKEPELYLEKMRYAVNWANKSILLDKVGIQYFFEQDDNFKKSFNELAEKYPEPIQKSMGGDPYSAKNSLYEKIFLKAYKLTSTAKNS